jgi:hypothetical protein
VGVAIRRAFASLTGHRSTVVVPPPAHVVAQPSGPMVSVRRKAVTGEIIRRDAPSLPRPSV